MSDFLRNLARRAAGLGPAPGGPAPVLPPAPPRFLQDPNPGPPGDWNPISAADGDRLSRRPIPGPNAPMPGGGLPPPSLTQGPAPPRLEGLAPPFAATPAFPPVSQWPGPASVPPPPASDFPRRSAAPHGSPISDDTPAPAALALSPPGSPAAPRPSHPDLASAVSALALPAPDPAPGGGDLERPTIVPLESPFAPTEPGRLIRTSAATPPPAPAPRGPEPPQSASDVRSTGNEPIASPHGSGPVRELPPAPGRSRPPANHGPTLAPALPAGSGLRTLASIIPAPGRDSGTDAAPLPAESSRTGTGPVWPSRPARLEAPDAGDPASAPALAPPPAPGTAAVSRPRLEPVPARDSPPPPRPARALVLAAFGPPVPPERAVEIRIGTIEVRVETPARGSAERPSGEPADPTGFDNYLAVRSYQGGAR